MNLIEERRNSSTTSSSSSSFPSSNLLKEYLSLSPEIIHSYYERFTFFSISFFLLNHFFLFYFSLLLRKNENQNIPWSILKFSPVLIADISGFTKLASKLRLEELKYHIK